MKNEKKSIDFFYKTDYSFSTTKGITKIYKEIHRDFRCRNFCKNQVESKIEITDTYYPTFTIVRKNFCISCWLDILNS